MHRLVSFAALAALAFTTLTCMAWPGAWLDANDDGVCDVDDLYSLSQSPIDLNNDGVADQVDTRLVEMYLRRFEQDAIAAVSQGAVPNGLFLVEPSPGSPLLLERRIGTAAIQLFGQRLDDSTISAVTSMRLIDTDTLIDIQLDELGRPSLAWDRLNDAVIFLEYAPAVDIGRSVVIARSTLFDGGGIRSGETEAVTRQDPFDVVATSSTLDVSVTLPTGDAIQNAVVTTTQYDAAGNVLWESPPFVHVGNGVYRSVLPSYGGSERVDARATCEATLATVGQLCTGWDYFTNAVTFGFFDALGRVLRIRELGPAARRLLRFGSPVIGQLCGGYDVVQKAEEFVGQPFFCEGVGLAADLLEDVVDRLEIRARFYGNDGELVAEQTIVHDQHEPSASVPVDVPDGIYITETYFGRGTRSDGTRFPYFEAFDYLFVNCTPWQQCAGASACCRFSVSVLRDNDSIGCYRANAPRSTSPPPICGPVSGTGRTQRLCSTNPIESFFSLEGYSTLTLRIGGRDCGTGDYVIPLR